METNPNIEKETKDALSNEPSISILIVEDNPGDVVIEREILRATGIIFNLTFITTLGEALLICVERNFDIILLDLGLPDSLGLETLKKLQAFKIKSPVVVMTGLDDEDIALAALREGAQDYLVKSKLTPDAILSSIRYSIARKKIQDLLSRHKHQFSILSSATGSITRCEDISSIYKVTCENIAILLNEADVIGIEFNNPMTFHDSFLGWIEPYTERIKSLTGVDIRVPSFHLSDQEKNFPGFFTDGKLHEKSVGLYEVFATSIERNICAELERLIGIKNIYTIGFIKGGELYGGALIFSPEEIDNDNINIIEAIGNHASLSIHRQTIEKELRQSEYQFRKLSKQLEHKVKERTKDLQSANGKLSEELIKLNLTQEALRKSETQLKELNITKDKFFNIVAHDLKNPFTSLLGSSELLFQNIDNMDITKIKKLALILNESAKSGYAILLNLLDWSRSQTGLLKFEPEKINLKTIIDENIAEFELSFTNKEIEIFSDAKETLFIFADKNMLNTVFRNLISNAIKFTHRKGKVIVSSKVGPDGTIISVKDNGIGISKEDIDSLFRIETRHSLPGTENEQGTGLGLKLSREFVEKQGGKIWVESNVGKGSEFKFTIPRFTRQTTDVKN